MSDRLEEALKRFQRAVIFNGLSRKHFAAGVDPGQLQAVFDREGLPLHPDIATFYEWHDGYNREMGPPWRFTPGWTFESIESALSTREEVFKGQSSSDSRWLWPVASTSSGCLAVHLVDGALWDGCWEADPSQLEGPCVLADLIEFWTTLHDDRYWTSAGPRGWAVDHDRMEADFGPIRIGDLRGHRF